MSWIVVDRKTGQAVVEIYDRQRAAAVNSGRFEILTFTAYAARINAKIKREKECQS